ncbi:unnamed protein product [Rotaria sp. Silwood2]|nr:unnamed protein product [Rotaria sp. Silwood2]
MTSIGNELYDSRSAQNHITLSSDNRSLTNSTQERADEVTMLSNISAMDTWCSIPVCLTKDQIQDGHDIFDDPFYSNNSTRVENMFPEYVRLVPDLEDEPEREKNIEDSSNSLINSEEVRPNDNDFSCRVQVIEPNLTILRMDSSEKYELPRRILQVQKAHVVLNYKKYCDESDFDGLCRTKLFDILNSIKPSQQQAVSGLDEFVVEGVEAWRSLSSMIQEMAIPQVDRKRLLKQMEMAEIYQKSRHIDHCSANSSCAIYCCTFGLSDPNCAQYYSACTQDLPYFGRKVKMSKIKISKATIIEMPKGTNTENDSV